ncbi:OmpA family protein [Candidatus Thiothrix sp. Deng01]|uniref:OmpA family protein n=1 Tax=Candidatus Thiothrix phosphatis TaxID=3112415 RepID=A0ABU6D312_9GAMM|nr:OmpA family protein [Candidatus Thiothrix sp. Deng01]MEB4593475.1 OmpA family protein [Candidatus Thiothrix sp. Deng01]
MAILAFNRQQLLPLTALTMLVVVGVLTLLSLLFKQSVIETDLLQRTRQALVEAGLPADIVHFSGRDGILTGTVASDADAERLLAVVSGVYGVRAVSNRLIPVNVPIVVTTQGTPEPLPAPSGGLHAPSKKYPIEQIDLSAIQFEYSKAELNAEAINALQKVIAELKKTPSMKIEVSAHTDNQGTALGNMAVTQARAEVIRNYLLSQDIDAKQVKARGYGSTRPVADNANEEGARQNRRIEITVLEE